MGYLENPIPAQQIVIAKVTLKPGKLLAPSVTDIPEFPAIKDYYWQVLSMNGIITGGTLTYIGTSSVHIQASSAITLQYRFSGGYMQSSINTWQTAILNVSALNGIQFVSNDKLQIHNPSALTVGDSDLILYITAVLIKE